VKELGGKVTRDERAPGKPVVGVNLGGKAVTGAGLKELAAFKHLTTLNLSDTDVTDADLKQAVRSCLGWLSGMVFVGSLSG
jgi:hypothetical protein